jgi:hypothetical protein
MTPCVSVNECHCSSGFISELFSPDARLDDMAIELDVVAGSLGRLYSEEAVQSDMKFGHPNELIISKGLRSSITRTRDNQYMNKVEL